MGKETTNRRNKLIQSQFVPQKTYNAVMSTIYFTILNHTGCDCFEKATLNSSFMVSGIFMSGQWLRKVFRNVANCGHFWIEFRVSHQTMFKVLIVIWYVFAQHDISLDDLHPISSYGCFDNCTSASVFLAGSFACGQYRIIVKQNFVNVVR
jgi:hypothetical protein